MKPILRFAGGLLSAALVCAAVPAAIGDVGLKLREGPPGLSRYEPPLFPEYAKHRGISKGSVLLAISWRADGVPADVVVLSASFPAFGETAQDAAWQWRRSAGQPAVQTYGLSFELNGVIVVASKMLTDYAAETRAERAPRAVQAEELDVELRAVEQPMPAVSTAVSSRYETGRVVVEFFVDEEGRVRAPTVVHATADEFAQAALAAMSRWRYETPRRNGQPVVASMRWAFEFKRTS